MRLWLPLFSVLLSPACWVTSSDLANKLATDTDTDTDTDSETVDTLDIRSVSPKMASNGGGTEVEIETTQLAADVEVLFGDRTAQVLGTVGNRVIVAVPKQDASGWVDVEVRSGGVSAVSEASFYLWPDGTDKIGAIGIFERWYKHDLFGIEDEEWTNGLIQFVEPTTFRTYEYWSSALDTCARDYSADVSALRVLNSGANRLVLESGIEKVALNRSSDGPWFEMDGEYADFIADAVYTQEPMSGGENWPSEEVPRFVETPSGRLNVLSPNFAATLPSINRTVTLEWETDNVGDFVLVNIFRYSGQELQEGVSCVLRDDGFHIINGSLFTGWSTAGTAYVAIGRATAGSGLLPHDGSRSDVLGIDWASGFVWTY